MHNENAPLLLYQHCLYHALGTAIAMVLMKYTETN